MLLESALLDGQTRRGDQFERVVQVVDREQVVGEQFASDVEMTKVGAGMRAAGGAAALGVERAGVVCEPGPLEVIVAVGGEDLPVAGKPGRPDAVEQIGPKCDGVEHTRWVAQTHDVAHFVTGELGHSRLERPAPLLRCFPHRQPPYSEPGNTETDRGSGAGTPQQRVGATLDDPEQRLVGPSVRRQGALAPAQGPLHRRSDIGRRCR